MRESDKGRTLAQLGVLRMATARIQGCLLQRTGPTLARTLCNAA
jgi:hypothetical protein